MLNGNVQGSVSYLPSKSDVAILIQVIFSSNSNFPSPLLRLSSDTLPGLITRPLFLFLLQPKPHSHGPVLFAHHTHAHPQPNKKLKFDFPS